MDFQIPLYGIAIALVVVGFAGIILPALPGVPLIFAGLLCAAWADDFQRVGVWTLGILGILTLVSIAADLWATAIGAKRVGASRPALIGTVLGTIIGLFFGLPGLFLGPFAGAVIGELVHHRDLRMRGIGSATRVGVGTWVGIALGVALKVALAMTMLALFVFAWFI